MPPASLDTSDATYARVAELPLSIERCELLPLVRDVSSGFTKVSTVVRLSGDGQEGLGEDITWDQIDQLEQLRHAGDLSWLRGTRSFDEFSMLVGLADLFPVEPIRDSARYYRRWAYESAALDLALRQSGLSMADAVGRSAAPVTFVVSMGLGEPAGLERLRELRYRNPSLRFKLDPTPSWGRTLVAELAALDCVDVIDMKGRYDNARVAMAADPHLYRRLFEALPSALIEDPAVTDDTAELLERHRDRITWDEPIHGPADIDALPWVPRVLNLKPSRFGSVRRLFDTYDHCEARGIGAYGGGMFEQGPGRGQLQYLASLFHPDGPNDLAPVAYNMRSRMETCRAPRCRYSTTRPGFAGGPMTRVAASASEPMPPTEQGRRRDARPLRRTRAATGSPRLFECDQQLAIVAETLMRQAAAGRSAPTPTCTLSSAALRAAAGAGQAA